MTNEEFFEKVKGKKIRLSAWPRGEYVIPYLLKDNANQSAHAR
jgi:endogenous inhibitor of DNA gyrase (YacG/DUF329 family)